MKLKRIAGIGFAAIIMVASSLSVLADTKPAVVIDNASVTIREVSEVLNVETADIDVVVEGVTVREVRKSINTSHKAERANVYLEIAVDEYQGKTYTIPVTLFGEERTITFTYLKYDSDAKEYVYYANVTV